MNERIKQLAEDAWDATAVSSDFGHPVSFAEKFAKLIIQECCDQVREIDAMEIRKHFGITPNHHAASEWPREL